MWWTDKLTENSIAHLTNVRDSVLKVKRKIKTDTDGMVTR